MAVLFDFGGTLDADGITWKERAFQLYREAGVAVTAEEFAPHFYRADDALVGTVPPTCSLRETVTRLFAALTEALRPGDRHLAARLAERFLDDVRRHAAASAAVLARLQPRYRLGVVSNFYGNLDTVCADLALASLFGAVVDSTRVGATKPDPRIFETALVALGVDADETTFVGDSVPRDMLGARGVGMRHIWLAGAGQAGARRACCADDPVIHSLADIADLLA